MSSDRIKKAELLARDKDEALLGRRMLDLDNMCSKRRNTVCTGFLSESEQAYCEMLFHMLDSDVKFMGGYDNAQRCVAVLFYGEAYELSEYELPYSVLKLEYGAKVTHRDILGSILGLGIERSTVGDILVWDNKAYVFVIKEMAQYVERNLLRIGRQNVSVGIADIESVEIPEVKTEEIFATVASLRLDSVVGEGFRLSRDDAKIAVQKGIVSVNHRIVESASHRIRENDVISLKGRGKIVVESVGTQSKKGRIRINLLRYV